MPVDYNVLSGYIPLYVEFLLDNFVKSKKFKKNNFIKCYSTPIGRSSVNVNVYWWFFSYSSYNIYNYLQYKTYCIFIEIVYKVIIMIQLCAKQVPQYAKLKTSIIVLA